MIRAVVQVRMDADNRISAECAGLHCFLNTIINSRDIFLRDRAADRRVLELVEILAVRIHRCEDDLAVSVLAVTAGLLCILVLLIDFLGECLLVGNLRSTDISLNVELTHQSVDDNLQMKLAHAGDDRLARLRIRVLLECRVLFSQLCKCNAELLLASLCLRLDRELDDRLRELHGLEDNRMLLVAERIACRRELEADCCSDITGVNLVKLHSLVCVHLKDTRDTLLLALCGVEDIRAGVQRTRVNSEVSELSDERICHDLECQSGERLTVVGLTMLRVAVEIRAFYRRDIKRARHVLDDCIEHLLDALVSVSSTAGNRDRRTFAATLAENSLHFLNRRLLAIKVLKHQILVQIAELLNHLGSPLFSEILHIVRDICDGDVDTLLIIVDVGLHFHQIDQTLEFIFLADRQLDADRILAETIDNLLHAAIEVSADDIHLIDKCHTRYVVLVRLSPDVLGLRLNASLCREDADGAIEDAERTLNFDCEVDVPRCIDDVDSVLKSARLRLCLLFQSPMAGGSSGCDRDTTLLLLFHPVHGCCTIMCLTNLIVDTCVVQDTLCQSGLAGIDMSHDTNVSGPLKRIFSLFSHSISRIKLESVMAECLVGFCHSVHFFLTLNGCACIIDGIHNLICKAIFHSLLGTIAGEGGQPAKRQRLSSVRTNLDRYLICSTADTSCLYFQNRHDVVHCFLESINSLLACLFLDLSKCAVYNLLCNALLTIEHDLVDQLGNELAVVNRIC